MPEAIRNMTPRSESEAEVGDLLTGIGLHLEKTNYILYRGDSSEETEIDLVLTYRNATFIIEVTINAQKDARRRKRKALRTWETRGLTERVSTEIGLPRSNHTRIVYASLATEGQEDPELYNDIVLMHGNHVKHLEGMKLDRALDRFIKWCGLDGKIDPGA